MTKRTCGVTLALAICAAGVVSGGPVQKDSVQIERLNPRIGPAKPKQYKAIRDAKDWKNPILVIRRDGIQITARGLAPDQGIVAPADLQRALIDLAAAAWPYGRVVVVSEIGILDPYRDDRARIARNLDLTLAILKRLQVTAEMWP